MILQDLLDGDVESLEKMTDEELRKVTEQYYIITRPELAVRVPSIQKVNPIMAANLKKVADLGIDIGLFMKKKGKR
jgi:hypothetical protein